MDFFLSISSLQLQELLVFFCVGFFFIVSHFVNFMPKSEDSFYVINDPAAISHVMEKM